MFPSYSDHEEQDNLLEDLLADCAAHEIINTETGVNNKRQRRASSEHNNDRKAMHRDIERQRRQEMSALYASLRSLLPFEYIKGKRAVTDQLQQAGCYIKHMQEKIEKMQTRRDKLMKKKGFDVGPNKPSARRNCVKVSPCGDGMEILIGISGSNKNEWSLSKVFADLVGRSELDVVSCVSTRASDEWSFHKIQIEANDPTSIDLPELQKRLVNVIN